MIHCITSRAPRGPPGSTIRLDVPVIQRRGSGFDYPRENYTYDAAGQLINGCMVPSSSNPCNNEYGQAALNAYAYDSAGNRVDTTAHAVIVLETGQRSSKDTRLPTTLMEA